VDCLALGMLTAIHRCLDLVNGFKLGQRAKGLAGCIPVGTRRGNVPAGSYASSLQRTVPPGTSHTSPSPALTIADIPPEDPATYQMIQKADTIGVFQIESRAQMAMLPRLKPACFYDLVIQVAIVRPGPIQGNMVHPYLQRRRGLEAVVYPSVALQKVLQRTLGVPIFQEQVMQIAMVAAGFSGSEADLLRRSMAAWARRGDMQHMRQRLIEGMLERGYPHGFAMQIFEQIKGFGEYGFPESHAASFALLAYVSAWLKRHHPAAFACALLNSQPMGFYQPAQLVQDARRHGVTVLPADVRYSAWDCTLEPDAENNPQLRLGLRMVKGLGKPAAERISAARIDSPFSSAQDLTTRARLNRRELAVLAAAAALRGVAGHRHRAYWEVAASEKQPADLLLGIARKNDDAAIRPATESDDLKADYAATGLTLGRHPLALVRGILQRRRIRTARQLLQLQHGTHTRACGLVTMRQRPMTANGTIFLTLEDETGHVNVVVWQRLWERQRNIVLKASVIAVDGVMESDGEVYHLIARQVHDYGHLLAGLQTRSRDFC
jgi:error-prone DNA polymerase